MNNVLIFAGGTGSRMNSRSRPKQFLQFYGKELIVHTLENFQGHPEIDGIVVVCVLGWIPYLEKLVRKYELDKVRMVVGGGSCGQESIYNGLVALKSFSADDDVVLVHDGVRPFVSENLISDCICCVREFGSAITVTPSIETVVEIRNQKVESITDRLKCYHAKAPQCFFLKDLYGAHEQALKDGMVNMIDSATLMHHYGYELYVVQGNFDNIKITTPADFYTFKALYEVREQQQIFGI